jgi:hypothetical protein
MLLPERERRWATDRIDSFRGPPSGHCRSVGSSRVNPARCALIFSRTAAMHPPMKVGCIVAGHLGGARDVVGCLRHIASAIAAAGAVCGPDMRYAACRSARSGLIRSRRSDRCRAEPVSVVGVDRVAINGSVDCLEPRR